MDLLQTITIILSSLAAIMAWFAKIRWSNQFIKAKDEQIKAKDEQIKTKNEQIKLLENNFKHLKDAKDGEINSLKTSIEQLKEFSPIKLREYFLSVKEQLEEYNEHLKEKLNKANEDLNEQVSTDDRFSKILEMIVGIDVKTNKYLDELEAYSEEFQTIQRAIKDDSFELPSIILKPNREEIEKYKAKISLKMVPKNKSTIDMSKWAPKNHEYYKNM